MSQEIIADGTFFYHSILAGLLITFFYDWFLIIRKCVKHNKFWISFEDLLFWIVCGLGVFYLLYKENNGILRWFAVVGAGIGIVVYKKIIQSRFVNIMSTCIHKIMWLINSLIQVVLKPIKCLFITVRRYVRFFFGKCKKCIHFVKKKLTVCIKMLKMFLCKQ